MPPNWIQAMPNIIDEVSNFNPSSILEVGSGIGSYGVLLRDVLDSPENSHKNADWNMKIDGFELSSDYKKPIHKYVYNKVYYGNVSSISEKLSNYDVLLLVDVLEHFEKEDGKEFIRKLISHTNKALIISTPLFPTSREDKTKSRWYQLDFADFDFNYKLIRLGKNGVQLFIIHPLPKQQEEIPLDTFSISDSKLKHKKLTVAYFLPHKNLTGGLKMLLEQMKHLRKRGHKIYAIYKGDDEKTAIPSWINLQVDKEIIIPKNESYLPYINECDVGIVGWFDQIRDLSDTNIPIVYWEQGSEYLFGENLNPQNRNILQQCYQHPIALTSVSPIISKIIQARFGRKTPVIPNGIDTEFYYPSQRPNENIILLVGNPNLMFKGFEVALQTLIRVWLSGYKFKIRWVCQVKPSLDHVPFPFPIEYIVMPSQEELAKCYRHSDIFLFTSWYEGFGMPPLEAMASGIPVVSTACGGIDVYIKNGVNAIVAEPGDSGELAKGIIHLLQDKEARDNLAKKGRETALKFSTSNMINQLENYLYQFVS